MDTVVSTAAAGESKPSASSQWRGEAGHPTWIRYRGRAVRGKPRTVDVDRIDLDYALEAMVEAEDLLDEVASREVVREALAKLDLAARFILDVRKRCAHSRDEKAPDRRAAIETVSPDLVETGPRRRRKAPRPAEPNRPV